MTDTYVARPPSGAGPGVMVLHEWWGPTAGMRAAADRIAAMGYVATLPDLRPFSGGMVDAIRQLRSGRGELIDKAMESMDDLLGLPEVTNEAVGIVGVSQRGSLGMLLNVHTTMGALAVNYGMVPADSLRHREIPVVASYGTADRLLPRGSRPLVRRLSADGPHDVRMYRGARHSFMTAPDHAGGRLARMVVGARYDAVFADHAWGRIERHLKRHLVTPRQAESIRPTG